MARDGAVFAHVIVGNNTAYTISNWANDIKLATKHGIDAFALNVATPLIGVTSTQVQLAFEAIETISTGFRLFLSFDYLGGQGPWTTGDIVQLLQRYCQRPSYYHYDGKPFVSTFEGPTNSDVSQWATIRNEIPGGIYFVPDWTSQGPAYRMDLYDGAFSWDMWPDGPCEMTAEPDRMWKASLKSVRKAYMMGVSPWFYTNLPAYHKAWVWRGDRLWYDRWQQVLEIRPEFVQVVSWNDFGESHYVGPLFEPGIPQSIDADARSYVRGFPHEAWLETLPYQIAAYKHTMNAINPLPTVREGEDRIVFWYRTASASKGSTQTTGNHSLSPINTGGYQRYYRASDIVGDRIFAIALLSDPGDVSIAIGDHQPQRMSNLPTGISFVSRPFNGQFGPVMVQSSSGLFGRGPSIERNPADGIANFNAWVGCARP